MFYLILFLLFPCGCWTYNHLTFNKKKSYTKITNPVVDLFSIFFFVFCLFFIITFRSQRFVQFTYRQTMLYKYTCNVHTFHINNVQFDIVLFDIEKKMVFLLMTLRHLFTFGINWLMYVQELNDQYIFYDLLNNNGN